MYFRPTPEQRAILQHDPQRHARILAGPGTGKSTTLVAFLDQLLSTDDGLRVRMLTFTRAATAELAEKLDMRLEKAPSPSTLHSFAISVLLRNPGAGGFPEPLRIADTWEDKQIVRNSLARRINVPSRRLDRLIREMSANFESLTDEKDEEITTAERARFLGAWNEHRHVFGYTLLAELPFAFRRALRNHDDLRGVDSDVLLVDEYQDLNACDLEVIRLVAEHHACSIIACGDDDQSIYSWRKAAPEGIRRFLSDYESASDYSLSVSRRCRSRILEWANYVISGDPERPADRTTLVPASGDNGGEVALLRFNDDNSEAKGIAEIVSGLIRYRGVEPREILILMRSDHNGMFSKPIRQKLEEVGVGASETGVVGRILEEEGNRTALERLRLVVDGKDSIAWASLLELAPGVGTRFHDYIYKIATNGGTTFADALLRAYERGFPEAPRSVRRAREEVSKVLQWLGGIEVPGEQPAEGWGQWIIERSEEGFFPELTSEFRRLLSDLDEHFESRQSFPTYLASIEPLGKDIALAKGDSVRLMTMGGSKGLTARVAVIAGVGEELLSRPGGNLSEERRILYVAMTRAKSHVFCTWARRRRGPTAWAGVSSTGWRRLGHFLEGGPVDSVDGPSFVGGRFAQPTS